MRIASLYVDHFRCLKDVRLSLDPLTVLVGRNGAGKSAFLRALETFYDVNAPYSEEDYYNRDTSKPIVIALTYTDLSPVEKKEYRAYLDSDTLTVEKELTWPRGRNSQKYYGSYMGFRSFDEVRAQTTIAQKRQRYRELRQMSAFADLPDIDKNAGHDVIAENLAQWEARHPEQLERIRDQGQFFGFREVGQAKLERYTRFVFVPAVRDAAEDAAEGRGRVMTELMDLVVRSALRQRQDIQQLCAETLAKYRAIVAPEGGLAQLQQLRADLDRTLQLFAPGTSLRVNWDPPTQVALPFPEAKVELEEDGYSAPVDRVGHGLQRAFILTLLEYLSLMEGRRDPQSDDAVDETMCVDPGLIIALEEAELYQHPARQRHLARILFEMVHRPPRGVSTLQVICSTHSPLLVDIERFQHVRVLRRVESDSTLPRVTRVSRASLQDVVKRKEEIFGAEPGTFCVEAEKARLRTLMTAWTNEGFFAEVVILVEGEEDRAALLGVARSLGHHLEGKNIALIPCNGKTNLPKAALIFEGLEIPTYLVWDGDANKAPKDAKPEVNRALLTLVGAHPEDYPNTTVAEHYACFRDDLTSEIRCSLGNLYDVYLTELTQEYGFQSPKDAKKNPAVVEELLRRAQEENDRRVDRLVEIVEHILAIAGAACKNGRSESRCRENL